MRYLGWKVNFERDGERCEHKLINFFLVGSAARMSVWALCLCPRTGEIHRVKVIPNDNDFIVEGKAYRPLNA